MRYAKIKDGKVENVIALNDEDVHLMPSDWVLVKSETANIGDNYVNGVFFAQAPAYIEPPAITEKLISAIAFKLRFTSQERIAIYERAGIDPVIKDFVSLLDDLRLLNVDLMLLSTIESIDYLISQNLIAASRKNEILG